jgi:autotransporter translocation and assembly factor TamB
VRPRLSLTREANGRYRLPSPGLGSAPARPTPRIQIGSLSIVALDVQIEGAPPMTIEARDVSASFGSRDGRIEGRLLAVNGVRFRSPAGTVADIGVDGTMGLTPDAVLIGPLTLTMAGNRVEVQGSLPFAPGPPRLDLTYRGAVNLADAATAWPILGATSGRLTATGSLSGPLSDLVLTFDAAAQSPAVAGIAVTAASATGSVGQGAVRLSSATIDVLGGRISGTASSAFVTTSRLRVHTWRGVQLNDLLRMLDVPPPFPLAARLDGESSVAWDARGLPSLRGTAETRASGGAATDGMPVGGRSTLKVGDAGWALDLEYRAWTTRSPPAAVRRCECPVAVHHPGPPRVPSAPASPGASR